MHPVVNPGVTPPENPFLQKKWAPHTKDILNFGLNIRSPTKFLWSPLKDALNFNIFVIYPKYVV